MPVYVNTGIGGQLVMIPETVYGTVPAGLTSGSAQPYEFNSEKLKGKKNPLQGKGIHAGGLYNRKQRRVNTFWEATGPVSMDLPTRYLNQLLFLMMGSKGQPAASMTQDGVTGAYLSTHGPGSLFGTSMCIQVGRPPVDGIAPLPFTYTGMKLTDWEIAVQKGAIATLALNFDGRNELGGTSPAGTKGDPLNASVPALAPFSEAASNSIFHFREATLFTGGTIGIGTFGSALASPPAVPASTVAAVNSYGFLTAVTITGGTLTSVVVNGVQVGTVAGTYAVPANGSIAITYSSAPTWTWFAGVTTLSGQVAAGNVQSASVKQAFHLSTGVERVFLGSNGFKAEQLEVDYRDITGQFVIEWLNSHLMYDAFSADTATTLQLSFVGNTIGSGSDHETLTITIPNVFLEGDPPEISGPGIVTQTLPFTGLDDGTYNAIQIAYASLDPA